MGGQTPRAAGVLMAASVVLRGSPLPKFCVGPGPAPSAWVGHLSRIPTAHDPNFRVPCSRPSSNSLPRGASSTGDTWRGPAPFQREREKERTLGGRRGGGEWGGWRRRRKQAGLLLRCPPPAPSVLGRLGPSEEAADISVRTPLPGAVTQRPSVI